MYALSAMLSDAVRDPAAAGLNVMLIVHDADAATLLPQLLVCENDDASVPVNVMPVIDRPVSPVLARVTVSTALATPSTVEGKDRLAGERLTTGAVDAGHLFTTLATFREPSPVARSYPAPAANPESTPAASVDTEVVQFGVSFSHTIAIVPVSMSLNRQAPDAVAVSVEHAEYVCVAASVYSVGFGLPCGAPVF